MYLQSNFLTQKTLAKLDIFFILIALLSSCANPQRIPEMETGGQKPMSSVEWIDQDTGHKLIKLTRSGADNRSFYFHNNPFIPAHGDEGDLMVFYGSEEVRKSDHWYKGKDIKQLFTLNLKSLEIKQLTHHSASISGEIVGKKRREVFYQSSDTVFAVNVDNAKSRIIYVFPDSLTQAKITTLNADEQLLAGVYSIAEKDSILKNNPRKGDYFNLIYEAKLPHTLFTLNVDDQKISQIHSDSAWLNHVQFSPTDPERLMFCHEGPWHFVDRIWSMNIHDETPMLMHKRTVEREIAGHEFFSRDGKTIWFDLQIPRGETFYLAGANVETGEEKKYAMTRDEWSIHFNISPDQSIFVGDGGDSTQVARAKDGMWLYLFRTEGDSLHSEKLVNMKHHNYDLEPNVHFSPDGKWIIFRANFEGSSQIYAVDIEKDESF
ncbi:oligogalacturonate lyase family protein [Chondrinema litorale]|uniref:oligogalacturonate lyase family protein n=1 Tax=Chondrinema litorale TaxID=2994555 RepID=UPI002543889E|nr:oligogalacturonate lyase family protein [Chondrinema litorale]UZR97079.1 oligogalacturonate lyase family protein [Chondrinema litorale]